MNHLRPAELVDAADGVLAASRQAHLEQCRRCAAQAATVRLALDAARELQLPEPSPLYWPQMAGRIRERVAGEAIVPAWRAAWGVRARVRGLVPLASALVVVAALFAAGLALRQPAAQLSVPVATTASAGTARADAGAAPEDTAAWDALTSAAAAMPLEDAPAAGIAVQAAAIDRAVQRLTPEELEALERLLQSELRRSGD